MQALPFSVLRRLLVLLALAVAAPRARAAYTVTITGGTWTSTGNGTVTRPDQNGVGGCPTGGGFNYANGTYQITAGAGTAQCAGAMVAHFAWQGSGPRPPALVVKETSTATWQGDTGSCATGMPNPVTTPFANGATKTSVRYQVIQDPAASFDLPSVSPAAQASAAGAARTPWTRRAGARPAGRGACGR